MYTSAEIATALNRSHLEIENLRRKFELPTFPGAGYSEAYLVFLRIIVRLRTLHVSEAKLSDLWKLERKLMQLLHADSTGSPTWFLDSCGVRSNPERRLLLSNYELGVDIEVGGVQLGLDFAENPPELFPSAVMGEDALRILNDYRRRYQKIRAHVDRELPMTAEAVKWAKSRMR